LPLYQRIVRDRVIQNISKIYVDSRETFGKLLEFVRDFVPNAEEKLEHYPGERPLFELYNIEDDLQKAFNLVKSDEKKQGYMVVNYANQCQGRQGLYMPLSQILTIDKHHKAILFTVFSCTGNGLAKRLVMVKQDKYQLIKNFKMADMVFIGDMAYLDDRTIVFTGYKWTDKDGHCCPSQKAELHFNIDSFQQELITE